MDFVISQLKNVWLSRNEKQTYGLNSRPQMWPWPWKVTDNDRGDFRCRRAVDSFSYRWRRSFMIFSALNTFMTHDNNWYWRRYMIYISIHVATINKQPLRGVDRRELWRVLVVVAGWLHYHHVHYNDVIMSAMASQITSLAIVYSMVYSGADQRKHQSSASLAFVRGIHRWPVNSLHKWPVTRKCFHLMTSSWTNPLCPIRYKPFRDLLMRLLNHSGKTSWDFALKMSSGKLSPLLFMW